ncbi:ran-binding protein 3-like [Sycon ciliatum]|uniref:ran-binding protein 3-like n=1 Tax=Sycon ciliatum TaxID=27933 RepID=UPI0031F705D6
MSMESDRSEVLAAPTKRPATEEPENEAASPDGSAAKKLKPASTFSELASQAASKDSSGNVGAAPFDSNRPSIPLDIAAKKKSTESTDSDNAADSPAPLQLNAPKFSNSPMEVPKSPLVGGGSFSLAPPTLAAPGKKSDTATSAPVAATAAVATGEVVNPLAATGAATVFGAFHNSSPGSHLIKDFGFGPRPVLDKAPKPSVPSDNPFLQCLQKSKSVSSESTTVDSSDEKTPAKPTPFVFGQNLTDRVKVFAATSSAGTNGSASTAASSDSTNSSADTSAAASSTTSASSAGGSAAARDLPLVDVVTGEEGEKNIMQISCRLYNFNRDTRQWVEKGRAIVRVNDKDSPSGPPSSRLVIRSTGSLRVMVNCLLWAGQSCEKVNIRSARLTVMNDTELEIVLVKASPVDIADLVARINARINALKNEKEISAAAPPSFTASKPAPAAESDEKANEASESAAVSPPASPTGNGKTPVQATETPEHEDNGDNA